MGTGLSAPSPATQKTLVSLTFCSGRAGTGGDGPSPHLQKAPGNIGDGTGGSVGPPVRTSQGPRRLVRSSKRGRIAPPRTLPNGRNPRPSALPCAHGIPLPCLLQASKCSPLACRSKQDGPESPQTRGARPAHGVLAMASSL